MRRSLLDSFVPGRRPTVRLRAPQALRPDEEVPIAVELTAPRALNVTGVTVTLLERRRLRDPLGLAGTRSEAEHGHVALCERRRLPPGKTTLSGTLRVGAAWPSWQGGLVEVAHRLVVHVDVPWWPDAVRAFPIGVLPVRAAGGATPGAPGAALRSPGQGLQISLDRSVVKAGGALDGWWRARRRRVPDLALDLVAEERAGGRVAEAHRRRLQVRSRRGKMGRVGFKAKLPDDLAPSMDAGDWRVEWFLEATAEGAPGWLARVPLVVAHPAFPPHAVWHGGGATARTRRAWRAVGQRVGLELDPEDVLAGTRGPVTVAVRLDERPRRPRLVAEVRWPALHVELWSEPRGEAPPALREVVLDDALRWSRANRLHAREPGQVAVLLEGAPARALTRLGTLRLDDRAAVAERRWSGAAAEVEELASAAVGLAEAMEVALDRLPPPAAFRPLGVVDRWRALARRLEGCLHLGSMRIEGRTPAGAVEIKTRLASGGTPRDTFVRLRPSPPLPERWAFTGDRRRLRTDRRSWPEEVRHALGTLLERHGPLAMTPHELTVRLPAPLLDPAPAEAAVVALDALCRALQSPAVGPYR